MHTLSNRARLGVESLDARDMPSAVLPTPDAGPAQAVTTPTADQDVIDVRASGPRAKTMSIASPGVTRVPPTALDQRIMAGLQNRKWVNQGTVTNQFTGTTMRITTEIVLVGNGNFSLIQAAESPGIFAPVVYHMGSSGRWWVQNNGVLVMQNLSKSHSTLPNFDFMRVSSWGNGRFVSPDSGTWFQIPQNVTYIPGP